MMLRYLNKEYEYRPIFRDTDNDETHLVKEAENSKLELQQKGFSVRRMDDVYRKRGMREEGSKYRKGEHSFSNRRNH